jgi:hypothetical protein
VESRRHSKLESGSEEEKVRVGVGFEVVPVGPESIWVSGKAASAVTKAASVTKKTSQPSVEPPLSDEEATLAAGTSMARPNPAAMARNAPT